MFAASWPNLAGSQPPISLSFRMLHACSINRSSRNTTYCCGNWIENRSSYLLLNFQVQLLVIIMLFGMNLTFHRQRPQLQTYMLLDQLSTTPWKYGNRLKPYQLHHPYSSTPRSWTPRSSWPWSRSVWQRRLWPATSGRRQCHPWPRQDGGSVGRIWIAFRCSSPIWLVNRLSGKVKIIYIHIYGRNSPTIPPGFAAWHARIAYVCI